MISQEELAIHGNSNKPHVQASGGIIQPTASSQDFTYETFNILLALSYWFSIRLTAGQTMAYILINIVSFNPCLFNPEYLSFAVATSRYLPSQNNTFL